jgi:hypothetical protein
MRGPSPLPAPPHDPPTPKTVLRPHEIRPSHPPETEPGGVPEKRKRAPLLTLIGVIGCAVVVSAVVLFSGSPDGAKSPVPKPDSDINQEAGNGENLPPGTPTVVVRTAGGTKHVTWTYSAELPTDTFAWRTADGSKSGTTRAPELNLPSSGGTPVCVQVRVVRADGGDGSVEWSVAGCG